MSQKKLKEKTRAKKEEKKTKKQRNEDVEDEQPASDAQSALAEEDQAITPDAELGAQAEGKSTKSKSKKRKLDDSIDAESGEKVATVEKGKKPKTTKGDNKSGPASASEDNQDGNDQAYGSNKQQRFIVFIGNLPYSATPESIKKHFAALSPFTVRQLTDKKTKKPRGVAFLEFEQYDRMKTCLKLYHHSSFDDGKKPARKINVELTAGGGGKSEARQQKLKEKNEKLNLQRRRRMDQEAQRKHKQEQKRKDEGGEADKPAEKKDVKPKVPRSMTGQDASGIHPSRLAQMGA